VRSGKEEVVEARPAATAGTGEVVAVRTTLERRVSGQRDQTQQAWRATWAGGARLSRRRRGLWAVQIDLSESIHDLRRTTATMMTKLGITNRFIVGKILNHAEPGVTKVYDIYDYLKEKRAALDAWGKRVAQVVSELRLVEESRKADV